MLHPTQADQDRFSALFSEIFSDLNATIYSMLPDRAAPEEVLQNTAVVLWEKSRAVTDPLEFRKIAFTVMRFQVLSYKRDRLRDRLCFDEGIISLIVDPGTLVETTFSNERDILEKGLQALSQEERELLFSAYQPGVKITHLASQQGKTPMSLYKKIQKIRTRLIDHIRAEEDRERLPTAKSEEERPVRTAFCER